MTRLTKIVLAVAALSAVPVYARGAEPFQLICWTHRTDGADKRTKAKKIVREIDVDTDRQRVEFTKGELAVFQNSNITIDTIKVLTQVKVAPLLISVDVREEQPIYTRYTAYKIDRVTGKFTLSQDYIADKPREYDGPETGIHEAGKCRKKIVRTKF